MSGGFRVSRAPALATIPEESGSDSDSDSDIASQPRSTQSSNPKSSRLRLNHGPFKNDPLLTSTAFLDAICEVTPPEQFGYLSFQATAAFNKYLDAFAECLARNDEAVAVVTRGEEYGKQEDPMFIMAVVGEDRSNCPEDEEGERRLVFTESVDDELEPDAPIERVVSWCAGHPWVFQSTQEQRELEIC